MTSAAGVKQGGGMGAMLLVFAAISAALGLMLWGLWFAGVIELGNWTTFAMIVVRMAIVVLFLAVGWREVRQLFRRPAKNMGTGLNRVWSVGRTTILEAWAGRIWLLPILWLIASAIMISAIRPFDESERMPLNIRMLLSSQEMLLLVMMLVMACLSLPRERERKIIITNASKPLSRLEIVLGKMLGFSLVAGIMVGVMGVTSWGLLHISNYRIMKAAAQSYELQQQDYNQKVAANVKGVEIVPPSEGTKQLATEGSLYAYNYVPVRTENLSIVGAIDLRQSPPARLLKGGSSERAIYRFSPGLIVPEPHLLLPPGQRAYFEFFFPVEMVTVDPRPSRVQVRVVATRTDPRQMMPAVPVEKVITLSPDGAGVWEPDPEAGDLYSGMNERGEITINSGTVTVEVQCITPGVMLRVYDGADPDPETGNYPDVPWNVLFRQVRGLEAVQPPQKNPLMRGFERREKQEIEGPKRSDMTPGGALVEQAVFRFLGRDLAQVRPGPDDQFELGFTLDTYKTDNLDARTRARIQVKSLDSLAEQPFNHELEVTEKRLVKVKVPSRYLGNPDPAKRGDMVVIVACWTPEHSISMNEGSCRIELPSTPFWLNLFKSEAVILLEAVLLIGIAVTCSVRLGWPVAMLVTVSCMLFGYFADFILELQHGGGLEALNYRPTASWSMTYQFFDTFTSGLWRVLGAIATFVPDFTIYKPQDYITNLQNMPLEVVLMNAVWTMIFLAPFVGLAYLMFRKQELG